MYRSVIYWKIYAMRNPLSGKLIYVGMCPCIKPENTILRTHIEKESNYRLSVECLLLRDRGFAPVMELIEKVPRWLARRRVGFWIRLARQYSEDLCNLSKLKPPAGFKGEPEWLCPDAAFDQAIEDFHYRNWMYGSDTPVT